MAIASESNVFGTTKQESHLVYVNGNIVACKYHYDRSKQGYKLSLEGTHQVQQRVALTLFTAGILKGMCIMCKDKKTV